MDVVMTLLNCNVCGGAVANTASACPHCGNPATGPVPKPKKRKGRAVVVLVAVALVGGWFLFADCSPEPTSSGMATVDVPTVEEQATGHAADEAIGPMRDFRGTWKIANPRRPGDRNIRITIQVVAGGCRAMWSTGSTRNGVPIRQPAVCEGDADKIVWVIQPGSVQMGIERDGEAYTFVRQNGRDPLARESN